MFVATIAARNSVATATTGSSWDHLSAAEWAPCFASSKAASTVENSVAAAAFASISNGFWSDLLCSEFWANNYWFRSRCQGSAGCFWNCSCWRGRGREQTCWDPSNKASCTSHDDCACSCLYPHVYCSHAFYSAYGTTSSCSSGCASVSSYHASSDCCQRCTLNCVPPLAPSSFDHPAAYYCNASDSCKMPLSSSFTGYSIQLSRDEACASAPLSILCSLIQSFCYSLCWNASWASWSPVESLRISQYAFSFPGFRLACRVCRGWIGSSHHDFNNTAKTAAYLWVHGQV